MAGIARYSIERFGEAQTGKYVTQIESSISRAVERPALMRARPELGAAIFSFRCGSHVAFLTRHESMPEWMVIAVLHARMDPARHIGGEG